MTLRLFCTGLTVCAALLLASPAAMSQPTVINLTILAGGLPPAQRVVRIYQDDEVALRWTADAPVTIHLHGYDMERKVRPGAPATMQFRARATGRFPITVHGDKQAGERTLGHLEVHPR